MVTLLIEAHADDVAEIEDFVRRVWDIRERARLRAKQKLFMLSLGEHFGIYDRFSIIESPVTLREQTPKQRHTKMYRSDVMDRVTQGRLSKQQHIDKLQKMVDDRSRKKRKAKVNPYHQQYKYAIIKV